MVETPQPTWLTIVAHHVLQFKCTTSCTTMSQSSNHIKMLYETWQGVHRHQMVSPFTRSRRANLGCDGTEGSHHNKTLWGYHVNAERKCQRNASRTSLKLWHEELRQLWRENELQPGTNKSYVKCPLSVIHLEPPLFFLIQWRTSDYS